MSINNFSPPANPIITCNESLNEYVDSKFNKLEYFSKLRKIVAPILEEIAFETNDPIIFDFSRPIDPTMAYAQGNSVRVCPLFVIDLDQIPQDLRPSGSDDPKLYDLTFLQKLSDWIADEFNLEKEQVGLKEIATIKTILKLKEDPKKLHLALRAGLVHELGHIACGHTKAIRHEISDSYISAAEYTAIATGITGIASITTLILSTSSTATLIGGVAITLGLGALANYAITTIPFFEKCAQTKKNEREADRYAAKKLKDGVEGMKAGFGAWQETLKEIRSSNKLCLKDRILAKLVITPNGNLTPLLLTHGSFEDRIQRAALAANCC